MPDQSNETQHGIPRSYQYDESPIGDDGKTYETLTKESWEHVFSFPTEGTNVLEVQEKINMAKASGRYTVTVVQSETSERDKILYIVKKLKPEHH